MALPVTSKATAYDLAIVQGSTLTRVFQVVIGGVIQDLTGVTAASKVRDVFTGSVIQLLTCSVVTGANSTVTVSLTMAQTAALTVPAGTPADVRVSSIGVWDLELTDGVSTYRFAEGIVTLSREATY
jgi:hypothetical protein